MKAITLIVILSISCLNIKCSEAKELTNLHKLFIVSDELMNIVDSLILHEEQMEYYTSDLLFIVHFQKHQEMVIMQVGSIGVCKSKSGNELGWFERTGHIFIVSGDSFSQALLEKTNESLDKNMCNNIFCQEYDEKGIIGVYEDDKYTYWDFTYFDGNFTQLTF